MPTFCRHNRFIERCPICRQELESAAGAPGARRSGAPRSKRARAPTRPGSPGRGAGSAFATPPLVTVRHTERAQADGYQCDLVPGLKASLDARRLAQEITFAAARLAALATDPPGLFAEAAADPDRERATALVFLTVYLSPLEGADDPFAGIRAVWPQWQGGELPRLDDVPLGPRTSHDPRRRTTTLEAYQAWWRRAGSQEAAFGADGSWGPGRRFDRLLERLALPGLGRSGRYDLLVTLGRLGLYELRPSTLALGENDDVLTGAKRVFGIGERVYLERRAAALAHAADVPIEALDLALFNWQRGVRATVGVPGAGVAPGANTDAVGRALAL